MYQLISNNQVIAAYYYFMDAWLDAIFLPSYSSIVGPDGTWKIEPKENN